MHMLTTYLNRKYRTFNNVRFPMVLVPQVTMSVNTCEHVSLQPGVISMGFPPYFIIRLAIVLLLQFPI